MSRYFKWIIPCSVLVNLVACAEYQTTQSEYQNDTYSTRQFYSQVYQDNSNENYYTPLSSQGVQVPDSYHVSESHSPVSFKDRDKEWATSQNPQGFTILLGEGEKASHVAQKLYKAPKNDRMGEVKSVREGKEYYQGLYGSYDSMQAAQKALDELPAHLKEGADIKNWSVIQKNLN